MCDTDGPTSGEPAWSAKIKSGMPPVHFLKSPRYDPRCPIVEEACRRTSYLVPGINVLVCKHRGEFACVLYTLPSGRSTTELIWTASLDLCRDGDLPAASEWSGRWNRDAEADIDFRRLDEADVGVEDDASWGSGDPVRAANGGIHPGTIEATRVRLTGHALHFVSGQDDAPPVADGEYEGVVDMQLKEGELRVEDNGNCGGMNVTLSGAYQRVTP